MTRITTTRLLPQQRRPWRGHPCQSIERGGGRTGDAAGQGTRRGDRYPHGAEVRGLQSTAALWYLGLDSELLFVGDAGTTQAGRPSRRLGLEWTNYARLAPWLTADADLAFTRARFRDGNPAGTRIPGALDRVISAGVTIEPARRIFGSVRVRHFGPRPLNEDATVTSHGTTLWNGEAGYRISSGPDS